MQVAILYGAHSGKHCNNKRELHNAVAELLCLMLNTLGGDAASDQKTTANGRAVGQNPRALPSGNRVDAIPSLLAKFWCWREMRRRFY